MSPECLFCKIAQRKIQARTLSESDDWLTFHDIHPQAPVHFLIIPKKHIENLSAADPAHAPLIGSMMLELARLAAESGVGASGYRVVANCSRDGGQTVPHLHFHLLGGRSLTWPPG